MADYLEASKALQDTRGVLRICKISPLERASTRTSTLFGSPSAGIEMSALNDHRLVSSLG